MMGLMFWVRFFVFYVDCVNNTLDSEFCEGYGLVRNKDIDK